MSLSQLTLSRPLVFLALVITLLATGSGSSRRSGPSNAIPGPVLAPPPQASSFFAGQHLSPASALLANEFFASERQKASSNQVASPASSLTLASELPVYSKALPALNFRLDQYHSLDELNGYFDALARKYKHVSVFPIGQTHEGRPIKALEIVNNKTELDFVWLDALTHAREWITGSTITYIIDQLVSKANPGQASFALSKNYLIIPVVNPDGYSYTWSNNRMWRKNRSKSGASSCFGADINRNFDHSFGGEGSSSDPCSHIFSGHFPFSESESRSMADLMWSLRDRIKFYLTIHSYNQLWACPYASTLEESASLSSHMRVLRQIQRAVHEAEGVTYEIGPLSSSLYVGSGFGLDFAYDKCKIEHSYLVELRDKGTFGFQLPADQIMPTARETWAGLQAGLRAALTPTRAERQGRL